MAIIYDALLNPSKQDLLAGWLPSQPWFEGPGTRQDLQLLGAFRFDDPAGEVGMETHLVRSGSGPLMQVPLSYRGTPLPGAEAWLVTTMEHSVLGRRCVYDACADPVYATALAAVIMEGQAGAEQFLDTNGTLTPLAPTASVSGSGTGGVPVPGITTAVPATADGVTRIDAGAVRLAVYRKPQETREIPAASLSGTLSGSDSRLLLAAVV